MGGGFGYVVNCPVCQRFSYVYLNVVRYKILIFYTSKKRFYGIPISFLRASGTKSGFYSTLNPPRHLNLTTSKRINSNNHTDASNFATATPLISRALSSTYVVVVVIIILTTSSAPRSRTKTSLPFTHQANLHHTTNIHKRDGSNENQYAKMAA